MQLKYVQDDSTIFWAIGSESRIIAKRADFCGQEVEMTIPFEGVNSVEVTILQNFVTGLALILYSLAHTVDLVF